MSQKTNREVPAGDKVILVDNECMSTPVHSKIFVLDFMPPTISVLSVGCETPALKQTSQLRKECLLFIQCKRRFLHRSRHLLVICEKLLSTRTAMWSMPVDLTEMENENDSANQNDVAKMTLQNDVAALATQADSIISPTKP